MAELLLAVRLTEKKEEMSNLKQCSKCGFKLPDDLFGSFSQRGKTYSRGVCNPCRTDRERTAREENPEKVRSRDRERYRKRVERDPKEIYKHYRNQYLLKAYGITLEDYKEMLINQRGSCAICGISEEEAPMQRLHVDHCHSSGEIRGLLCHNCNALLGHAKDDETILKSAISYLRNF